MSSPTKAPVERRHREATLHAFGWGDAIGTENSVAHWAETGDERNTFAADVLPVVAQALADTEATAYSRGLADGAERERAAAARSLDDRGYIMLAGDIRAGKHLEQSE